MWLIKKIRHVKNMEEIEEYLQFDNREIYLDMISPKTISQIDKIIRFWNIKDEKESIPLSNRIPIKIFINSSGGILYFALILCDIIQMSKTPVYTYNIGCADFESTLVLMAGHKRFGYMNSVCTIGNKNNDKENEDKDKESLNIYMKQYIENLFHEKAMMSDSQINKYMNSDPITLTSDEAFKLHIINQILQK